MGDQGSTKSLRTFQCRDYLYEVFERMSSELNCSVDYLVNEAMREYARTRSQQVASLSGSRMPSVGPELQTNAEAQVYDISADASSDVHHPDMQLVATPQIDLAEPDPRLSSIPVASVANGALHILFNGDRIPIDKDEFIIGRGARSADLAIRDGNISRRHAAVVLHGGAHYIKDLGSTNGIEFAGRRVESKRIEEGDVYRICDYELRFTYR